MFFTRLFPYISSTRPFHLHTPPVIPGTSLVKKIIRSISSSSLGPEWPCLEECRSTTEQIARIKTQFLDRGGDINQKHPSTKKSVLYELLTFHHKPEEFAALSALFFSHGAKIDPSEYNDESPFSHVFFFAKYERDALYKIEVLAKLGAPLDIKNVRGETLLQTAERIELSRSGMNRLRRIVDKYISRK